MNPHCMYLPGTNSVQKQQKLTTPIVIAPTKTMAKVTSSSPCSCYDVLVSQQTTQENYSATAQSRGRAMPKRRQRRQQQEQNQQPLPTMRPQLLLPPSRHAFGCCRLPSSSASSSSLLSFSFVLFNLVLARPTHGFSYKVSIANTIGNAGQGRETLPTTMLQQRRHQWNHVFSTARLSPVPTGSTHWPQTVGSGRCCKPLRRVGVGAAMMSGSSTSRSEDLVTQGGAASGSDDAASLASPSNMERPAAVVEVCERTQICFCFHDCCRYTHLAFVWPSNLAPTYSLYG